MVGNGQLSLSSEYAERTDAVGRCSKTGARRLTAVAVLAAVLLAAAVWSQPVLAAMQLSYFNITSNPTGVVLEWGTAAEINLAGFDVLCKQATEPDSAYHPIGFMPAKGGPTTPATYTFPVTSGLVPGASYCFQLREVTTDGSIGEAPALCGYGPNVTPTPSLGVIPTFFVTQTAVIGALPTDAAGNPIRIPPLPGVVPTDAFGNPVVTPVAPAAIPTDAFGNPVLQAVPAPVATDAFGNPVSAHRARQPGRLGHRCFRQPGAGCQPRGYGRLRQSSAPAGADRCFRQPAAHAGHTAIHRRSIP